MNKIRLTSKILMVIFYAYLLWIPFTYAYTWMVYKYPVNKPVEVTIGNSVKHSFKNMVPPNFFTMQAPIVWKLACSLESFILLVSYMMMAICLIRLFRCYSKQVIFDSQCIRLIKHTGCYLFLINVMHLIFPAVNTYFLSMSQNKILSGFHFGTDDAAQLVIASLVIVVSWIMEEGKKIHDEQQFTV